MDDLISRQAAIAHAVPLNLFGREVMMVSVSELENLPSAQPETHEERTEAHACDLIDRQAAIDVAKQYWYKPDIAKALEELPSAQTEQTDCEYCHEDSDGYVRPLEKNCHAFVRYGINGWEISLKAKGWSGSAKIKYCPMCGRELKHG